MKLVILDAKTLGNDIDISIFESFGEVIRYETTKSDEIAARLNGATIAITNKVVIDQAVMDAVSTLKLICVTATGMNNVDLDYAAQKGIVVKNVAGYSTHSVAQHTITMALSLIGKVRYYDDFCKSDEGWVKSPIFTNLDKPFFEIHGKRWGIIGLGTIGRQVATIASAFGAELCYYSTSGRNTTSDYIQLDLETLLKTCDIITIHAPLNAQTKNLLDANELRMMKQDAILINVGRGGIVNEHALVDAINNEKIYAGFDVVEIEPMRSHCPLRAVTCKERLLLSPHIAWASVEARTKLVGLVANNIKAFLEQ